MACGSDVIYMCTRVVEGDSEYFGDYRLETRD